MTALLHTNSMKRSRAGVRIGLLIAVACIAPSLGCSVFGGGKQIQELKLENDRLLSEYRSQRDRLAALQETNAALEARLSESEKLLAKLGQSVPASRTARADANNPSSSGRLGSLSTFGSSRGSGTGVTPAPGSSTVGGSAFNPGPSSGTDSTGDLQWRPMRKP